MMNDQQDMNKRIFIFFLVVAILLIAFTAIQSYLFPKKTPTEVPHQKNISNIETKENQQTSFSSPKKENNTYNTKTNISYVSGNYDLLLGSRRISADNLKETEKIITDYGYIEISKIGGRIVSIYVNRYNIDIISQFAKKNRIFPTEIITTNPEITALLNFSKYSLEKNGNHYKFILRKGNVYVEKDFVINPDYTVSLNIKIKGLENVGISVISGLTLENQGSFGHSGAIIKTDKELIKLDADIEREQIIRGNIIWAGEENKYFLQFIATKDGFPAVHVIPVGNQNTVVLSEVTGNIIGFFFGGPKLYSLLGELTEKYKKEWNVDLALQDTIDFGIFGILGKPLFLIMHFIYNYVHNWGLTIIILTILLRIVLFPLNHKSLKAMKKMSDLAPEIQKLQKKYKDNPQKLQQEMMKLYAEHGANPMSGCLPILVQIPIFIALYNVLMVTVELKNVPFLWIPDLSDKDPYYILPILMGLSMIAQQWITPSSDKNQKMIMYIMAAVFTFMFMNFPAGLVLYWLTNNILGIIQSFIINKQLGKYDKKNG
ncbi:MAG: membrane protein insertase YidC [Aquificae bacterium]|nr:membrane protein insertase YidC [Aquificota bacterium]